MNDAGELTISGRPASVPSDAHDPAQAEHRPKTPGNEDCHFAGRPVRLVVAVHFTFAQNASSAAVSIRGPSKSAAIRSYCRAAA